MNIKVRNPITSIILSLVTCGIYGIIWVWGMAKDAVSVKEGEGSGTLEAVLSIFFPFIGLYLAEKKLAEGCAEKGIEHKDNSIMYLILCLLGPCAWVAYYMLQSELNKIAEA